MYDKLRGNIMEVRIKLKVKDIEIEMSMDEAKELTNALNELTGKETIYVDRWTYPSYPVVYPQWPITPSWTCSTTPEIRLYTSESQYV